MYRFFDKVESTGVGNLYRTLKSLAESYGRIRSVMY